MVIRLDVLISILNTISNPQSLYITQSITDRNKIVIKDKEIVASEFIFYDPQTWEADFVSPAWESYTKEVKLKGKLYQDVINSCPSIKKIKFENWFHRPSESKVLKKLLLPPFSNIFQVEIEKSLKEKDDLNCVNNSHPFSP